MLLLLQLLKPSLITMVLSSNKQCDPCLTPHCLLWLINNINIKDVQRRVKVLRTVLKSTCSRFGFNCVFLVNLAKYNICHSFAFLIV